jgi:hypothetical protein
MAYMNQERKATLVPGIKQALMKHKLKGRISVPDRFSLRVTISEGPVDFFAELQAPDYAGDYIDVNTYHYQSHFVGKSVQALDDVICAMQTGNWDNSDSQTDYFDIGWYIDVRIGKWDKPYILTRA